MEQEQTQQEQAQPQPSAAPKKSGKKWWIIGGVGCVVLLLLACVVIVITYVVSNNVINLTNKSDKAAAQVVLRNAVADAEQYAADNDDSFDGMAAGDLTDIDSTITWVDGDPGAGQVGVIDAGQDTFTFTYKDDTGTSYQAIRESNGNTKYTDANGKSL